MRLSLILLLVTSWGAAQTLTVFAASSLTEAFFDIASDFERAHPGTDIVLNFAGSSTLATQLEQGARADIFVSADWPNLLRAADEAEAQVVATNRLVVITSKESPVQMLEQLGTERYFLVLAAEQVPAGRYALEVIEALEAHYGPAYGEQVLANLVSQETNVRQVAAKVELGEADTGIVYRTDARLLDNSLMIDIPEAYNVLAEYPAAVMLGSAEPELARRFLEFLLSTEGQAVLQKYGFSAPE